MPHCRVGVLVTGGVVPIQVPTSQGAAVVPHNHSIWVGHRHHLEYEGISENLEVGGGGNGALQQTVESLIEMGEKTRWEKYTKEKIIEKS